MIKENLRFLQKSFTLLRAWNALKAYSSYFLSLLLRKPVVWGYPPVIMIEPTNICNLRCPLCPSGNGNLKRERGYMDFELFKKIIDEVYPYSGMLILWNQGEPFLHKEILRMIEYASKHNMFTLISTNGNISLDAAEIIKSGLDSMIISLDGACQETYNKYRVNGDLSKVLSMAENLMKQRKQMQRSNPLLRWQFIVMKHNEHEISEIKHLAKKIGVDNLVLKSVQIYSKEDIVKFLPENPRFRRYKVNDNNFELKVGVPNRCRRIWVNGVVNWDGEMSVCCFDKDTVFPLGNVRNLDLKEIWTSKAFDNMRQQILKNRKKIEICKNCGESVKLKVKQTKVN